MYYLILGDVLFHKPTLRFLSAGDWGPAPKPSPPRVPNLRQKKPPAGNAAGGKKCYFLYLSPKYSVICESERPKYFLMSASTALSRLPSLL